MCTRAKKKYVASDRARREDVPRHILSYVIGNFVLLHKKRSAKDRTAAERKNVAKATRRRRRILLAGFFFSTLAFAIGACH